MTATTPGERGIARDDEWRLDVERARSTARSRRKRAVRARTVNVSRVTSRELELERALYPETDYWKPRERSECQYGPRPCLFVSCRHNLFLDVGRTGNVKLNFPDLEAWEMGESCSLDVTARGPATLELVADAMNLTRERVRQIETIALRKLAPLMGGHGDG